MMNPSHSSFLSSRETAGSLFRLFHLVFHLARAEAGWAVSFRSVGQISELTRLAFEDMEVAARICERLGEIPGGWRRKRPEAALARLLAQISAAPSPEAFWTGVFEVLKPALVQACVRHHESTHAVMDSQSVEALRAAWNTQGEQLDRHEAATDLLREKADGEALRAWLGHLRGLIRAAGGVLGGDVPEPSTGSDYPAHEVSPVMVLEPGQVQRWHFEEAPPFGNAQDANYFLNTEIAAVPMLGRLLYLAEGMPYEFFFDTARHMWDELRHFRMGRMRMVELGLDPRRYAIPVGHYNAHATVSPLESYCQLVLIGEATSFEYKLRWKKECVELGDLKSGAQQDFDIVDEQRHVGYGKKWIPVLRELVGEKRSVEEITADADRKIQAAKLAGMRAAGEPIPESLLRGARTAEIIGKGAASR